ncbi:MAG: hypothetical protein GY720_14770 [bacterium]|nr:hypothetical protein [bacterium]
MIGFANNHLAEKMASARRHDTDRRAIEGTLLPATPIGHTMRSRIAASLIRMGEALTPQPIEITPPARTSQPC